METTNMKTEHCKPMLKSWRQVLIGAAIISRLFLWNPSIANAQEECQTLAAYGEAKG